MYGVAVSTQDDRRPPIVIVARGFGGERDWRLPTFAEWFAQRGVAVLLFDYRRFGDSEVGHGT